MECLQVKSRPQRLDAPMTSSDGGRTCLSQSRRNVAPAGRTPTPYPLLVPYLRVLSHLLFRILILRVMQVVHSEEELKSLIQGPGDVEWRYVETSPRR